MSLLVLYYVVIQLLMGAPLDTLVDREHGLPAWYSPGLNAEALQAWDALQQAADQEGIKIEIFSDFRDYAHQTQVYTREAARRGENVDLYAAMPGHSEHQLGTVFDVAWPGVVLGAQDPRNDMLYHWLENNAHRFGFILSYPLKRIDEWPFSNKFLPVITEFIYEPWHIRYVGRELADDVYWAGYLDPNQSVLPQDFLHPWP